MATRRAKSSRTKETDGESKHRKPAMAAIRQFATTLAALDNLCDPITVQDTQFRIIFQNSVHLALMGEQLGKACYRTYRARDSVCDDCPLVETMRDGKPRNAVRCLPQGQGDRILDVHTSCLRDTKGNIVAGIEVLRDITERVRIENELRMQVERHRTHVAQSPLANIEFAPGMPKMIVTEWNPAAERIFGYSRQEAVGRDIYDLIVPRDELQSVVRVQQALSNATGGLRSSNANVTKDGRRIICEWYNTLLRDAQGQVFAIASQVQDITDRVEAQQALSKSETTLRAIIDNSPDAIGVSVKGIHTFVNPAYRRMFLLSSDETIEGTSLLELISPEARKDISERVQLRAEGRPTPDSYETRGLRRDGTSFEMDVSISSYDLAGEKQTLVFLRDVTERNRERRALEANERRFRALIEKSHDVVGVTDAQGRVTYVSPSYEAVLGRRPEQRLGQAMLESFHPEDVPAVDAGLQRLKQTPRSTESLTVRMRHETGRWVWLELRATNHLDDPAVAGIVSNSRDVSDRVCAEQERQKLERQMQHVQKLESLGVLAGGIAHDFNNILMSVLGHADLALSELSSVSPVRDSLLEIETAARRAAELTKQMLAYSGKGRFVVRSLDLGELVEEMTHMLQVSVSKKAVLRFDFARDLPPILADATQMRQIAMNLVINASEAIGENSGVIAVTTGAMFCNRDYLSTTFLDERLTEGTYVFLDVADTGIGMDKDTLARIFDPFFSTKFAGRGLGLAAVLGIVRGHKGALRVQTDPGQGSTFRVLLPACEQPVQEQASAARPKSAWRGKGTVLLVDDEETVRAVGKQMLERLGFSVITAENGRDALDKFRKSPGAIVVVVLDLTMPHMDGEETFRELLGVRSDVTVILSSGYSEQEVTQRFAGKGLAGFIQKPYNVEELAQELRAVLDRSKG